MLSLDACLAITTAPATLGLFRARDPRYTLLAAAELEAQARRLNRSLAFWEGQHGMDPEAERHRGYWLYWVWALKPLLLGDAVARDAFGSRHFFWIDVGCLRKRKYDGRALMAAPPQVGPRPCRRAALCAPGAQQGDEAHGGGSGRDCGPGRRRVRRKGARAGARAGVDGGAERSLAVGVELGGGDAADGPVAGGAEAAQLLRGEAGDVRVDVGHVALRGVGN